MTHFIHKHNLQDIFFLFFTVIFSIFIFQGYHFGISDQTAHNSFILKLIDINIFNYDPIFKDKYIEQSPYIYIYSLLSNIISIENIQIVFFNLYVITTFLLVYYSFQLGRLFGLKSNFNYIFILLLIFLEPFEFSSDFIIAETVKPSYLARPFMIASFYYILKNKYFLGIVISLITSLIHPIIGFWTSFFSLLLITYFSFDLKKTFLANLYVKKEKYLFIIITIFFYYFVWFNKQDLLELSNSEFLSIYLWRTSHNSNIFYFEIEDYISLILFSIIGLLSFLYLLREKLINKQIFLPYFLYIVVCIICSLYALSFSIYPTKSFVQLWPFRTFIVGKFFIILILTYCLQYLFNSRKINFYKLIFILVLAKLFFIFNKTSTLMFFNYFLFLFVLLCLFYSKNNNKLFRTFNIFGVIFLLLISVDLHKKTHGKNLFSFDQPIIYNSLNKRNLLSNIFNLSFNNQKAKPIIFNSFTNYYKEYFDVCNFLHKNKIKDNLFLVPYSGHKFRYLCEKSIYFDVKTIPFGDNNLKNWASRYRDLYNLKMNKEKWNPEYLDKKYKNITSEKLIFLKKKYNIKYALLYSETIVSNKVIYEDFYFKLIEL